MTRVALITGGQQGIGFAIADSLASAGYALALAADAAPDHATVKRALDALGSTCCYFQHDLRNTATVPALLDRIEADIGPITTLVANAGIPAKLRGDMLDLTPENFDDVLSVNLRGNYFLAQQVARRMLATNTGIYRSMIFVTSVSATMVSVERAEYCISKAAASMMTRLFAVRLAPYDIGVFELRPGIIETSLTESVSEAYSTRIENGLVPAGRWGQPGDIGPLVVPLATGQMAFATGAAISLDGGLSIPRL